MIVIDALASILIVCPTTPSSKSVIAVVPNALQIFAFLTDGAEGLFSKLSVSAITIGFLVLLGLVVVERVSTYQVDPYKEIER